MKSKINHIRFFKYLHLEPIIFIFLFMVILINAIVFNDNLISVVYAICGILYTIFAGQGQIKCYIFGIISTLCYSYLAYKSAIYGNMLLNLCYYLPMQISGIFAWKKNINKETNEILKTKLNNKTRLIMAVSTIITVFCLTIIFQNLDDKSPVIDSITTILSILAMYLTVKRCIEQWILWTIVNFLSIIMWIKISLSGVKAYSTILVWIVYFVLGIYFYIKWTKEINYSK